MVSLSKISCKFGLSRLKSWVISIKDSVTSFIHHFKILRDANISLGKYHLQNGNFKDASLRFWIVNKFFAPNDPENLYWSAWSDIMMQKYSDALEKLQDNSYDSVGLKDYIANMSTTYVIPEAIEKEYESISKLFKLKKYFNEKVSFFDIFATKLSPYLSLSDWDDSRGKYTLLEIGSHPFLIEKLANFLPEPHLIDAVNFSQERTKEAKNYDDKVKIYHEIFTLPRENFLSNIKKYDAIIAFDSLAYKANIKDSLKVIKNLLSDDGIFAFTLPKGSSTKLNPSENSFIYDEKYIKDNLKLADFDSMSITAVSIAKNYEFFIVVAK